MSSNSARDKKNVTVVKKVHFNLTPTNEQSTDVNMSIQHMNGSKSTNDKNDEITWWIETTMVSLIIFNPDCKINCEL